MAPSKKFVIAKTSQAVGQGPNGEQVAVQQGDAAHVDHWVVQRRPDLWYPLEVRFSTDDGAPPPTPVLTSPQPAQTPAAAAAAPPA